MAKKKPAPVDPQPGPTNLLLAMTYFDPTTGENIPIPAKPGGFVLLSLNRPPEHVRGDVYFAWMEKLSALNSHRSPVEDMALCLEIVLYCVKNFPTNYCADRLKYFLAEWFRPFRRVPNPMRGIKDVQERRDAFAAVALGLSS